MTPWNRFLRYALPVLLWALVIAIFSLELFRGGLTERVVAATAQFFYPQLSLKTLAGMNTVLRKTAHVLEYMVFALLVWRLLQRGATERWRASWVATTFSLSAGLAALDELHQFYTRGRAGSIVDVGWDTLGVVLALAWLYWRQRRAARAENLGS